MELSALIRQLIIGLSSGMTTYLMAAGLALVMSGMGVINFGQGAFYVLGAYVCYWVSTNIGFWAALLAAMVIVGLAGGIVEFMLRSLYNKGMLYQMLLTMGVSYILIDLMTAIFGYTNKLMKAPEALRGTINLLGSTFPKYYLFIIGVSGLVAIGFALMFKKTRLGMMFRAIIVDRQMVNDMGINVKRLYSVMFMLGVALSALGGALMAPTSGLTPGNANNVMSGVFTVLIIGGLTNIQGCFFSALIVGVINAFGAMFLPQYYSLIPATLMVIVLIIKPEGLFAKKR